MFGEDQVRRGLHQMGRDLLLGGLAGPDLRVLVKASFKSLGFRVLLKGSF